LDGRNFSTDSVHRGTSTVVLEAEACNRCYSSIDMFEKRIPRWICRREVFFIFSKRSNVFEISSPKVIPEDIPNLN